MKLKKLIALGLATVMSASILVGCSAKSNSDSSAMVCWRMLRTFVRLYLDTVGMNTLIY